jgi:hypothetical protein
MSVEQSSAEWGGVGPLSGEAAGARNRGCEGWAPACRGFEAFAVQTQLNREGKK